MKLPFSKRESLGVTLLLVGLVALAMFLFKFWLVASWVRGEYTGPKEFGAFWAWVTDPANRKSLEPVASLTDTVTPLVISVASFTFAALRGKETPPAIAPALRSHVADWHIIRPLLIASVRSQNVTGYEETSIFEGVRIALGAVKAPEALDRYYHAVRRTTGENLRLHKNGETILKVFTESGGNLLIQGEPGTGKSHTLHQLAARLLAVAEQKADAPVPVIVPLASWAMKKLPLDQWLAGELSLHYRLSAKDTPILLAEGGRLAILLDGLDEVTASARAECLAAIQKFMAEFRAPVAICCRVQEYPDLPERLAHGESIRLLPLTPEQVDGYLADFDAFALTPLRKLLKTDAHWAALAANPLMLGIMARVYASGGSVSGVEKTREERCDALFDFYLRQMFSEKARAADGKPAAEKACYKRSQAIHWLQQLASRMGTAPTYYIERMQPGWVRSRCCYALMGGLIPGLFSRFAKPVSLVETVHFRSEPKVTVGEVVCGLIFGLIGGLVAVWLLKRVAGVNVGGTTGLIFGLIYGSFIEFLELRTFPEPKRPNQGVQSSLRNGLLYGSVGAIIGATVGATESQRTAGVVVGLFVGLLGGFLFFGGLAAIQHYAIRLALAWEGTLPHPLSDRKLVAFLDGMCERMLLRRPAGRGGWNFILRELQEFLARCPYGQTPAEIEAALRNPASN